MLCGGGTVLKNDGTVKGAVRWVRWYGTVGTVGTARWLGGSAWLVSTYDIYYVLKALSKYLLHLG